MSALESLLASAPLHSHVPGGVLLSRGQRVDEAWYLESGRVAVGVLENGVLLHHLMEFEGPCWLEPGSGLLGVPAAVDMQAQTAVQVRCLPAAEFLQTLGHLPIAVRGLLQDMARAHLQQTQASLSRLVKDAESRCAQWLLQHAHSEATGALSVRLTQRKCALATQLGIAPETLSRVLRHLRERGLIQGSGKVFDLINPVGLRRLAGL